MFFSIKSSIELAKISDNSNRVCVIFPTMCRSLKDRVSVHDTRRRGKLSCSICICPSGGLVDGVPPEKPIVKHGGRLIYSLLEPDVIGGRQHARRSIQGRAQEI